jgi:hypothetical protein
MAKIEKSLEGPTLGSCHKTSKLKIKNPFYQIQVNILKKLHAENGDNPMKKQKKNRKIFKRANFERSPRDL